MQIQAQKKLNNQISEERLMSSHPEKFDKDYNAHKYFDSEGIDYSVKSLSPQELALRNSLVDYMEKYGMDVITDIEEGQRVLDEAKKLYPELKSDDDIADEAVNMYSDRRGVERLRQMQEEIAKGDGTATEKAKAIGAINRLKQVLSDFWKGVADFLHIHYTTEEDVADRVMKDMLDGVDPRKDATDEGLRKQFIGEDGAKSLDRADYRSTGSLGERSRSLDTAKAMEVEGKDAKAIKLATGWERSSDDLWRYEIDDATFEDLADKIEKKIEDSELLRRLNEAGINDVPWKVFTPEQWDELVNLGFEVTKPKGDIGADGMAIYEGWNRAYEEWRNGDRSKPFVSPKFDHRELPTVKDDKKSDLPEELFSHYGERATEGGGEVDFSKKTPSVERKYRNGVPLKLEGETIPDYVGVLSRSLSRNMANDAAKETLAKKLQEAADKYTTNALRSSEPRRLGGDILVTR